MGIPAFSIVRRPLQASIGQSVYTEEDNYSEESI